MPTSVEDTTVHTWKDGKNGYILFIPRDSFTVPIGVMEVQVMIEYAQGHTRVGMGNAYTLNLLAYVFLTITQNQWRMYQLNSCRRLLDGTVVHEITEDIGLFQTIRDAHEPQVLPPKILEERGRGTIITSQEDQGKLFQYWAHAQNPVDVGVFILIGELKYAYWMTIMLQPEPEDEDPKTYPSAIQDMWLERLRGVSQGLAQQLEMLGNDFGYQVRYVFNGIRI
jgi:hypothetical protein